jgi:hypothetical protein
MIDIISTMKKHSYFTLLLTLLVPVALLGQQRDIREVSPFTKIAFAIPGKLYIKQGSQQRVELVGDPDIIREVETRVNSGRLSISRESRFNRIFNNSDITVYITVPTLEGLRVSGSGDAIGEGVFKVREFDVAVSGSGSAVVEVVADEDVEADLSGSGSLTIKGKFREFESDVSGSGKVTVDAEIYGTADLSLSGSGKIIARGKAREVKADISGSGKVQAAELQATRCRVRISGSGDAQVYAKEELEADIGGSGSVSYAGDPRRVNSNTSGSGKVRKL